MHIDKQIDAQGVQFVPGFGFRFQPNHFSFCLTCETYSTILNSSSLYCCFLLLGVVLFILLCILVVLTDGFNVWARVIWLPFIYFFLPFFCSFVFTSFCVCNFFFCIVLNHHCLMFWNIFLILPNIYRSIKKKSCAWEFSVQIREKREKKCIHWIAMCECVILFSVSINFSSESSSEYVCNPIHESQSKIAEHFESTISHDDFSFFLKFLLFFRVLRLCLLCVLLYSHSCSLRLLIWMIII